MSSLDLIAAVALGFFLVSIATKGNSSQLIELAKRDKGYLQWAIALGILVYLYKQPELSGVMGMLIFAAFIGLGLTAGPNIIQNGKAFWASLGSN